MFPQLAIIRPESEQELVLMRHHRRKAAAYREFRQKTSVIQRIGPASELQRTNRDCRPYPGARVECAGPKRLRSVEHKR